LDIAKFNEFICHFYLLSELGCRLPSS
jgi:hypothetical protein